MSLINNFFQGAGDEGAGSPKSDGVPEGAISFTAGVTPDGAAAAAVAAIVEEKEIVKDAAEIIKGELLIGGTIFFVGINALTS